MSESSPGDTRAANDMADDGGLFAEPAMAGGLAGAGAFEPEPVHPYDPSDASGRRAMILLFLTFGGLLLLAWLVFSLYQPGVRDRDAPPIITASDQPFKTAPETPGGAQTPDQDREVYGAIDGSSPDGVTTAPLPEQPLDTRPAAPELPTRMEVEVEPVVPMPEPEPRSEPEPAPVVRTPAPSTPAASRPAVAGGSSDWVVQVASLRSQAEARDTYDRLSRRFASQLPSTASADIQRADLGDKGIYYRVRVAGLADKAAANRLCSAFKGANQACFVAKR